MALLSSTVTQGDEATAEHYNNLRTDATTHVHDGTDTPVVAMLNQKYITGKDTGGTARNLLGVDGSNNLVIGATGVSIQIATNAGVGGAAIADTGLWIRNSGTLVGTSQVGLLVAPAIASDSIGSGAAIVARLQTVPAAFTMNAGYGMYIAPPIKGAGSSILANYGLYVDTQTGGTNSNYGIYIAAPSGATTNIGLYNAGTTQLVGAVTVNANLAVTSGGITVSGGKSSFLGTYGAINAAADGVTVTFDLNLADVHSVTLGGNRTLALSNASTGQVFILMLKQDATGSRTVTWFTGITWAGGAAPTLTTTANKTDLIGLLVTGSGTYYGWAVAQNL